MNIKKLFNSKHTPTAMVVIGACMTVGAVVLTAIGTKKAVETVEELKQEHEEEGKPEPTKKEIANAVAKYYIPTLAATSAAIACSVGAHRIDAKRGAAIATAYALADSTLRGYQDQVKKICGTEKEEKVREAVHQEIVNNANVSPKNIVVVGEGDVLMLDCISGRAFKSTQTKIDAAVNKLNRDMRDEMTISLNEFYDEIGLEHTKIGDNLGWSIDSGYIEVEYGSTITSDGKPCLVLDYRVAPKYDYF